MGTEAAQTPQGISQRPDWGTERAQRQWKVSKRAVDSLKALLMEILGINTVRLSSKSATSCDAARLRVAAVLDVTGSMPDTVS